MQQCGDFWSMGPAATAKQAPQRVSRAKGRGMARRNLLQLRVPGMWTPHRLRTHRHGISHLQGRPPEFPVVGPARGVGVVEGKDVIEGVAGVQLVLVPCMLPPRCKAIGLHIARRFP